MTSDNGSIQVKNAFFFSHDCNARNNGKILELRSEYGAEAYGIYFMLIELLMESTDYMLKRKYSTLAFALQVDAVLLQKVVEDYELFDFSDNEDFFFSPSLLKRVRPLESLREKRRQAGVKSGESRRKNKMDNEFEDAVADDEQMLNTCSTLVDKKRTKESRVEKSKVEQSRAKESRVEETEVANEPSAAKADRFVPPTQQELEAYKLENKLDINTDVFLDFYQSKGWLVGKNKMKDWRAALRNWHRKELDTVQKRRRGLTALQVPSIANFKNDKVYEQF